MIHLLRAGSQARHIDTFAIRGVDAFIARLGQLGVTSGCDQIGASLERLLSTGDGMREQVPARGRPARPGWRPGGDLTLLEKRMIAGAAAGELVDLGEDWSGLTEMQTWAEERTVRAAVLGCLLVAKPWPVHAKGVQLRGARISGQLDLEAATLRCQLLLDCCYLDADEPICLDHATAPQVTLTRCQLAGLTGKLLKTKELDLSYSTLTGPLRLPNVDLTGQLRCRGAKLTGRDNGGNALVADGMTVGGGVILDGEFTAAGAVRLSGSEIIGTLSCSGAKLTGRDNDGDVLVADGMTVGGDVVLNGEFTAAGAVRLQGAKITGQLRCSGAKLTGGNNGGNALVADGIAVGGDVVLDGEFTAAGAVRLQGAKITGTLSCQGAKLTGGNNDGNALVADSMTVGENVFLDGEFTAAGAVRLSGSEITGSLTCRGAKLTGGNNNGNALVADNMTVGSNLLLDREFTAAGAVRLQGAKITGSLSCSGAKLTGRDNDGDALIANNMTVGGDVFLDEFIAAGTVSLVSVHVGASVSLKPKAMAGENKVALVMARAQILGTLRWAPAAQVSGQVDLEGASVGQLDDDWSGKRPNGYWPTDGRLRLDGFTYSRFGGNRHATVNERLGWIRSQYQQKSAVQKDTLVLPTTIPASDKAADFATQPYEQLAAVYRQAGQDTEARKVAIARRADLRKYGNLGGYRKFGNWLLDWTIRYGYQSWRAGVGLLALFAVVWVASALAQQHHLMAPVGDIEGLHSMPSATQCTSSYPCFYPAGYAVDTVIPIINVHQAQYWGPDGHAQLGEVWVVGTWFATGLGWALATLLVAGYTGLVRQD